MFTYENLGATTYLVYELSDNESIDTMSLGMLSNNKIDSILPVIFTQMDTKKYIKFNVSAKVSMKQYFTGVINKKTCLNTLSGILNALLEADEYMIDTNCFILDQEYIFVDVAGNIHMACLPVISENRSSNQYLSFFKNMIFNMRLDEAESSIYFTKLVNYLNSNHVLSLIDFKKLIESLKQESVANRPNVTDKPVVPKKPVTPEKPKVVEKPVVPQKVNIPEKPVGPVRPEGPGGSGKSGGLSKSPVVNIQGVEIPVGEESADNSNDGNEKKMSMLYLLRNFSKENLEIYKSQKDDKKGKDSGKGKSKKDEKKENDNFVIPGQEVALQPDPIKIPGKANEEQENKICDLPVEKKPEAKIPASVIEEDEFVGTVLIDNDDMDETTLMDENDDNSAEMPYLLRKKNGEKIYINKPFFHIGKKREAVDYCISDNKAVSRKHAMIIFHGSDYYIIDTNSKNHTFINGSKIQSEVENKLEHGVKVRLADEEFEFYLY